MLIPMVASNLANLESKWVKYADWLPLACTVLVLSVGYSGTSLESIFWFLAFLYDRLLRLSIYIT